MSTMEAVALELHRELVGIKSLSHHEEAIAAHFEAWLRERAPSATVRRIGDNVVATAGQGPKLLLNSHYDTVAANQRWTRDPWTVEQIDDRIYGLGSNDAKASVAAMTAAFLENAKRGGPCEVGLMIVAEEETGGKGTELAWPTLREEGWIPKGVVVGEPTGLDVAIAQKGLLVLELITKGDACHSANAKAMNARNAVRQLARDLVSLESVDLGPSHEFLGETTLEPTVTQAGTARNAVPEEARTFLDMRTVPGVSHEDLVSRVAACVDGELHVVSTRLGPRECAKEHDVAGAAQRARPQAALYGSRTMSDLVYFEDVPAIKCGPGLSERSHTPDEFVLASEIRDGAQFYDRLIQALASS